MSWSFSRKTHFDSCRRHYFYDRFWGQDPKLKWKLYEMRNISTLTMLRGAIVHEVISRALRSIRMGANITVDVAKQSASEIIRERYMESKRRLWHIDNRPPGRKASTITNLLEHYYNLPDPDNRALEARQVAWDCLENLMSSEIWQQIASSDTKLWMEIDEDDFPNFDLDGIRVYANIDFAHSSKNAEHFCSLRGTVYSAAQQSRGSSCHDSDGANTIIDWKTGAAGEQDRRQLTLYSLYAKSKWEWEPTETNLAAVYLYPEFAIDSFRPTDEDVESVRAEVKASFAEMLAVEPAYGLANVDLFPETQDKRHCPWCRFRGMCDIQKHHVDTAPA